MLAERDIRRVEGQVSEGYGKGGTLVEYFKFFSGRIGEKHPLFSYFFFT
jgi:hypothetical protein